jgi:hypothetical protein
MATSRSGKDVGTWIAGAFVYSGRPDPTWKIYKRTVTKLQELWESLPPADENLEPRAARLGYRGCFLKGSDNREWAAFKGLVSLKTSTGIQARSDALREFERTLLSSSPKGLLPVGLLESNWAAE